ncbi:hypothetical protein BRADI_1g44420v3 [Brachypodium distachyon]|uniref:aldehyde oxygenase (deformylating) n=1 Tax=Brachypodium distachyon TaxID=15368 RepID=I1GZB3_BRADI|nr:hypothetical protein BRADI_1g44420v3 [Brachypodium distachyon]
MAGADGSGAVGAEAAGFGGGGAREAKREDPAMTTVRDARPSLVVGWQFMVAMVVLDTWRYFGHRLMHKNKFLYRHVHSWHHRLVAPYAFTAQFITRGLLLDTLGGALALAVSGMSP